jgi:lipopolysaccharide export system permease protein
MKKLLFRNFLKDTLKFFIVVCMSISLIVWVIQAVGFLDFVIDDGHGLYVYFSYSLLNFPKMVHRIIPFIFFISLFYQISQYEYRNELLIFWTNGIRKIEFINVMVFYSLSIFILQIILGSYISPLGQNEARSKIRSSNVDFFPSLIKEGKFIDTVSNLTIFIDTQEKDGSYNNIFLKEDGHKDNLTNNYQSQTIYAKKGILINENSSRYFKLFDGQIINNKNGKTKNINFKSINFNLDKYKTKSTTYPKIQEAPSSILFKCLIFYFKINTKNFENETLNCNEKSIDSILQEFLKRFYKPIYLPLIALISSLLLIKSKESSNYRFYKNFLFLIIFLTIVISEISLRYVSNNTIGLWFFIFFPITLFFSIYIGLITIFNNRI